jgi:hypothetical protein
MCQIVGQNESLSGEVRRVLGSRDMSRAHTALGRLASLLSLPSHSWLSPLTLADHGVCNVQDKNLSGGLRFYQHLQVELENIYVSCPESGKRDIQAALEAQFKNNLLVRGFDSWNVPLSKSLNSMPALRHKSGLRGQSSEGAPITGLHALQSSDFVLSSSADDASASIWSTRAGLTPIYSFNFKVQARIDPKDSLSRA